MNIHILERKLSKIELFGTVRYKNVSLMRHWTIEGMPTTSKRIISSRDKANEERSEVSKLSMHFSFTAIRNIFHDDTKYSTPLRAPVPRTCTVPVEDEN